MAPWYGPEGFVSDTYQPGLVSDPGYMLITPNPADPFEQQLMPITPGMAIPDPESLQWQTPGPEMTQAEIDAYNQGDIQRVAHPDGFVTYQGPVAQAGMLPAIIPAAAAAIGGAMTTALTTGAPTPALNGGAVSIAGMMVPTTGFSGLSTWLAANPAALTVIARVLGVAATAAAVWGAIQLFTGGAAGAATSEAQSLGLSGPGVPEPPRGSYTKAWRTTFERSGTFLNGYVYFWKMNNGEIIYWSTSGKAGKYRPKKPIAVVMQGSNMGLRDFVRIDRMLDRFARRVAKRSSRLKMQTHT